MTPNLSRRHITIVTLTFAYLIVACVGGGVAIARDLPAEAFGMLGSSREIWVEFIVGGGTALSAPVWDLALMAVAATASLRSDRVGTVAPLMLAALAATNVVGALGEPITGRSFAPDTFDPLYATLSALLVAVPALLAVVAFSQFKTRRSLGRQHDTGRLA